MNDRLKKTSLRLSVLLLALAPALQAQEPPAAQPAKVPVLVLGTYHFANPNLDYVKTDVDDHLSEKRQKEIQDVVDHHYVGADVLSDWYQRNFRIFANLIKVIDSPEDRVLVAIGSSHSANLRELIASSPDLEVVEAVEYLGGR